jgi:sulfur carrier protein ThiS adenylyltransferase
MTAHPLPGRDLRQRDIIPPAALARCRVTVVGVGAIGRQVALQLAAVGVPWLQLVDPDVVEEVNLGPQAYLEDDVNRFKVEATGDLAQQLNHRLEVTEVKSRFARTLYVGNVLFCCVDSIATRKFIWEATSSKVDFFCDGRMSAEVLRVLAVADAKSREHYPTTLFAPDEAHIGSCTARSTIFCANVAAGLMLSQFSRWLRGFPVEADVSLNLLTSEMSVQPGSRTGEDRTGIAV